MATHIDIATKMKSLIRRRLINNLSKYFQAVTPGIHGCILGRGHRPFPGDSARDGTSSFPTPTSAAMVAFTRQARPISRPKTTAETPTMKVQREVVFVIVLRVFLLLFFTIHKFSTGYYAINNGL